MSCRSNYVYRALFLEKKTNMYIMKLSCFLAKQ